MIRQIVKKVQNFFGTEEVRKEPRVIHQEESKIDADLISPQAKNVCLTLQRAGYKAYIVGGAVRDLLIGHKPKDFDVATDATPHTVKRRVRRSFIIGRRFRLVHVIGQNETTEVATFRGFSNTDVQKDKNGVLVNDNVFGEQYEDAARRDFTINALYYDPASGDVMDYHDGLKDIRKKRIRMIGDPKRRYREDPVRILRAIRIAAKLGFKIDPKTAQPMRAMSGLLDSIPQARLADEVQKILSSGAAGKCLELLTQYGVEVKEKQFQLLNKERGNPLLTVALASSDERVQQGKKITMTFLIAAAYWDAWKKYFDASQEDTLNKKAEDANQKIGEKELLGREILPRFSFSFNELTQIWKLQVVMEERKLTQILKIAFARSFRAAHDLFVLRGELGQVSPELVDWWTKFRETEDGPEREQMISSLPDAAKSQKKKRSYKRKSSKVKSGVQNKSEVSARATHSISENTQLAEPSKNVSVPGTVEAAPKPSAELKTTPAEEDNKAKVRNSAKSKEATTKAKNDSEASPVIVQKKTRRRKKTTTVAQSNQPREQPAETEQTGRKKTPQKSVLLSNKS